MTTPILSIRDRNLSFSVFEFANQDGTKNLSVNIQRSYKKGEEWIREDIHCYEDDLLKLANGCSLVYNKLLSLKQKKQDQPAKEAQKEEPKSEQPVDDDIPF